MGIECNRCPYCQTKFEHTKDGRFQMLGKGCYRAPHWGQPIATIEKCPKYFDERDLNRIALGLNRKVGK